MVKIISHYLKFHKLQNSWCNVYILEMDGRRTIVSNTSCNKYRDAKRNFKLDIKLAANNFLEWEVFWKNNKDIKQDLILYGIVQPW